MIKAHRAWLAAFTVALAAPAVLAVTCGTDAPETVWSIVGVLAGVQAVVCLVVAVVLASRFRSITATFGIGGAMGLHRGLGIAAAGLALAHVVAVIADNPANVWLLDLTTAPTRSVAATIAFVLLGLLVAFAGARERCYEWWRWAHRVVAGAAVVLVFLHVALLVRLVLMAPWALFFAALATVLLAAAAWRWLGPNRSRFVVVGTRAESETVSTVSLTPCGHECFAFDAGQFAWMRLATRPWSEDHPLSMTSAPGDPHVEFAVRHTAGDWTSGPLRELRPGDPVWLDGPHGALTLHAARDAAGLVMVAAGAGLAPVTSMLRAMAVNGDERPVWLLVPPVEPLFVHELERLAGRLDLTVSRTLRRPVTVAQLDAVLPPTRDDVACYACGPPTLVADVRRALAELAVSTDRVITEEFATD